MGGSRQTSDRQTVPTPAPTQLSRSDRRRAEVRSGSATASLQRTVQQLAPTRVVGVHAVRAAPTPHDRAAFLVPAEDAAPQVHDLDPASGCGDALRHDAAPDADRAVEHRGLAFELIAIG